MRAPMQIVYFQSSAEATKARHNSLCLAGVFLAICNYHERTDARTVESHSSATRSITCAPVHAGLRPELGLLSLLIAVIGDEMLRLDVLGGPLAERKHSLLSSNQLKLEFHIQHFVAVDVLRAARIASLSEVGHLTTRYASCLYSHGMSATASFVSDHIVMSLTDLCNVSTANDGLCHAYPGHLSRLYLSSLSLVCVRAFTERLSTFSCRMSCIFSSKSNSSSSLLTPGTKLLLCACCSGCKATIQVRQSNLFELASCPASRQDYFITKLPCPDMYRPACGPEELAGTTLQLICGSLTGV